nr:hypothetical protein [Myxococcota bacterium]
MRITRFATPAALVALASAFTPSCESAECAEEVCFEGQGGSSSTAGAGGADAGQGGFSAAAGLSGTGGKTPTGGAGNAGTAGTPGSGGSAGSGASPEGGTDGGSNDGEAGSGGEGGAVPVCDSTKSPALEACLVSDEFAVFVSPGGADGGTGARSAPFASLEDAIELATAEQKVVVACGDDSTPFLTGLALTGELSVRVVGGFDCATWARGGGRTLIAPAERGPALTLEGVTGTLAFEDFEFRSLDALDGDGESSIAAVVSESEGVVFRRVLLSAG